MQTPEPILQSIYHTFIAKRMHTMDIDLETEKLKPRPVVNLLLLKVKRSEKR